MGEGWRNEALHLSDSIILLSEPLFLPSFWYVLSLQCYFKNYITHWPDPIPARPRAPCTPYYLELPFMFFRWSSRWVRCSGDRWEDIYRRWRLVTVVWLGVLGLTTLPGLTRGAGVARCWAVSQLSNKLQYSTWYSIVLVLGDLSKPVLNPSYGPKTCGCSLCKERTSSIKLTRHGLANIFFNI